MAVEREMKLTSPLLSGVFCLFGSFFYSPCSPFGGLVYLLSGFLHRAFFQGTGAVAGCFLYGLIDGLTGLFRGTLLLTACGAGHGCYENNTCECPKDSFVQSTTHLHLLGLGWKTL
jgi:hypothetical protein